MSGSPYYDAWVADGKPWRLATPILECANKIKNALPGVNPASIIGTIGDLPHLLAIPPQDHCPYSQTGWPVAHPYPHVTALDIMHRPDLGVDCTKVFPHWLAAAKAGQLPWLKYLVWQAKRYDARNGWAPVGSSGHYDHMHASGRSDTVSTSIGGFHPLPGYGDDMADDWGTYGQPESLGGRTDPVLSADLWGQEQWGASPWDGKTPSRRTVQINEIHSGIAELKSRPQVQPAPVDPAALKAALLDPEVLAAIAKAVNDEDHRRSES